MTVMVCGPESPYNKNITHVTRDRVYVWTYGNKILISQRLLLSLVVYVVHLPRLRENETFRVECVTRVLRY